MINWKQFSLQERRSPVIEEITKFHDYVLLVCSAALIPFTYLIIKIYFNKHLYLNLYRNIPLELFWTILPIIIIFCITIPALRLLYLLDDFSKPYLRIKTMGHQWFWSYEYADFLNLNVDSYVDPYTIPNFRLLDVDNRLNLPVNIKIRLILSSYDVLHAWTLPSAAIKIDAVPGRLNQFSIYFYKQGLFFGECSEICGINHRFIPITIEILKNTSFINWIKNNILLSGWKSIGLLNQ